MSISYEGELFNTIKNYLQKYFDSSDSNNIFGYDSHRGVPENTGWALSIDDYCANPDVYGIINTDQIILCQGKLIKRNKGKLWELVGQAISNRSYCNYLYIFFEKEYLEILKRNDTYYKDLKSILEHFKIGLLVVDNKLTVEEVYEVKVREIIPEKIDSVKNKILYSINSEKGIKKFLRDILNEIDHEPFKIETYYLKRGQPAFYISLDEWQMKKHLNYFIKFYKNRVLIGLNTSQELMKGGIKNKIIKCPNYTFLEYNGKIIDANFKNEAYVPELKKKTHDFHDSINLNQNSEEFFNIYAFKKEIKVMAQIIEKFSNIIDQMHPILKTLIQ